jgi:transcriptional regulator with XRE-family HTH domain
MMLGLSQSELGAAVDVSFQQIQKYESGINGVRPSTLEKLAVTLEVPINYFFDGPNDQDGDSRANWTAFLATSEGVALCSAFQHIESRAVRGAVIDLLQSMVRKH